MYGRTCASSDRLHVLPTEPGVVWSQYEPVGLVAGRWRICGLRPFPDPERDIAHMRGRAGAGRDSARGACSTRRGLRTYGAAASSHLYIFLCQCAAYRCRAMHHRANYNPASNTPFTPPHPHVTQLSLAESPQALFLRRSVISSHLFTWPMKKASCLWTRSASSTWIISSLTKK